MQDSPNYQDLVLIGGGHAHALTLMMWAMKPLPGVRVTLISPQVQTPYSGMLPGLIAGHYSYDETHIDLTRLCAAVGARFIVSSATGIDSEARQIALDGHPPIGFDLLSIDTGATPAHQLPGSEHAIPVKPISRFYPHWQALRQQIREEHRAFDLAVVGAGAGGCEIAMAMAHALQDGLHSGRVNIHLVSRSKNVPEGYPLMARKLAARELRRLGIRVHAPWDVAAINDDGLTSSSGATLALDAVFLCTQAAAPAWLSGTGLALDEAGFVRVDETLRSSHERIFAAGDVAAFSPRTLPKAGVYAVRQAPFLFHNLRATLLGKPLKKFRPQRDFLSMLACGDKRAVATRNGFALAGPHMWRWKNHIDQQFMQRFRELRPMVESEETKPGLWRRENAPERVDSRGGESFHGMRCNGCGAKVGADALQRALAGVPAQESEHLLTGIGDDAAVLQVPPGKLLVQSSDQLRQLVRDPWIFARIATLHALSDLFAMHATPASAQLLATMPLAAGRLTERDLALVMDGVVMELNRHGSVLSGGHTSEGTEFQLGLTVNGFADAEQLVAKRGVAPGELLILTKPLGVGAVFAAEGFGEAKGRWLQAAQDNMLLSNGPAAEILFRAGSSALTDVTGFGLLGHLLEMLAENNAGRDAQHTRALGAELWSEPLPLLPGAASCAENSWLSSLHPHNALAYEQVNNAARWAALPHWALLADPQTAGGLLASVPEASADQCIAELKSAGYSHAAIIGKVMLKREKPVTLADYRL
ncbi:selenide, water dikinase SelD [Biformimicrobium ophioploci]|uniref:Selenide, water dikinase n=1 Tax=Biformimicrobium ophioploci TaxID=3036711 RepID=A0ABQ6M115_9GAMM|nr:selenide, water dikinase SelD [Microbulbifer sp. NKW57]GMG87982.1 hypothetical protein MNKW57_23030 [Microbulbifer sp. NKW57]